MKNVTFIDLGKVALLLSSINRSISGVSKQVKELEKLIHQPKLPDENSGIKPKRNNFYGKPMSVDLAYRVSCNEGGRPQMSLMIKKSFLESIGVKNSVPRVYVTQLFDYNAGMIYLSFYNEKKHKSNYKKNLICSSATKTGYRLTVPFCFDLLANNLPFVPRESCAYGLEYEVKQPKDKDAVADIYLLMPDRWLAKDKKSGKNKSEPVDEPSFIDLVS